MDHEEFRNYGKKMVDYIATYRENIADYPVTPGVKPRYIFKHLPKEAPEKGENFDRVMEDLDRKIQSGVFQWTHPRFFAYFAGGFSYPCILADMLSSATGQVAFSWKAGPISTEMETLMLDWFGKALGLPNRFLNEPTQGYAGGVIQASASDAIFCIMMAARHRAQESLNIDQYPQKSDYLNKLVAYASKEAHSCTHKAANMCCVQIHLLETDELNVLRGKTVEHAMREDVKKGLIPFFITMTLGTTGSGAVDEVDKIVDVCKKYQYVWLHCDGAFGGNANICPEFREQFSPRFNEIDSLNVNPMKMLMVSVDCACMWTTDMTRFCKPFLINPAYLKYHQKGAIDHRNFGTPLSRRFRSLKLWFHFRSYGLEGIRKHVRNVAKMAEFFENKIKQDSRFEISYPRCVSLVTFRYINKSSLVEQNVFNLMLNTAINKTRDLNMTQERTQGKQVLRINVSYNYANESQMEHVYKVIIAKTKQIESGEHGLTKRDLEEHIYIVGIPTEVFRSETDEGPHKDDFGPLYIPDTEMELMYSQLEPEPEPETTEPEAPEAPEPETPEPRTIEPKAMAPKPPTKANLTVEDEVTDAIESST